MIAAKVEHQLALGAEAVSVEEAAKQWMSLTFRPGTSLLRSKLSTKFYLLSILSKKLSLSYEIQYLLVFFVVRVILREQYEWRQRAWNLYGLKNEQRRR